MPEGVMTKPRQTEADPALFGERPSHIVVALPTTITAADPSGRRFRRLGLGRRR